MLSFRHWLMTQIPSFVIIGGGFWLLAAFGGITNWLGHFALFASSSIEGFNAQRLGRGASFNGLHFLINIVAGVYFLGWWALMTWFIGMWFGGLVLSYLKFVPNWE